MTQNSFDLGPKCRKIIISALEKINSAVLRSEMLRFVQNKSFRDDLQLEKLKLRIFRHGSRRNRRLRPRIRSF